MPTSTPGISRNASDMFWFERVFSAFSSSTEIVAGASGYSRYRGGIEIQIDTRADCRRQGLAAACAARLILDCLSRGLYPSWDAANLPSLRLAEKLGYRFSHAYESELIWAPGQEIPEP